jgi:hypothetical protein
MLRFAVLVGLSAFIWFTLNDGPAVTKSSSLHGLLTSPFSPPLPLPIEKSAQVAPESAVMAETSTQASTQSRKPRPRSQVTIYSYRNVVRDCRDWYAEEKRPSGTVVVPHMRCRWVRR